MDKVIMNDDCMAITAHMNIQFNGINRQCEGVEKSSECIFGSKMRTSPMCNSMDMLIHELLCSSFMEDAGWRAVANSLGAGDVTVGIVVNVRHLAATPLGQHVRARAELIEIDGRRLIFNVEAYDEKRKIGEGQHERFIVNLERFKARID